MKNVMHLQKVAMRNRLAISGNRLVTFCNSCRGLLRKAPGDFWYWPDDFWNSIGQQCIELFNVASSKRRYEPTVLFLFCKSSNAYLHCCLDCTVGYRLTAQVLWHPCPVRLMLSDNALRGGLLSVPPHTCDPTPVHYDGGN